MLKQNFSEIKKTSIAAAFFACATLVIAYLGYPQFSLPILPIIMLGYLPVLVSLRRTVDCIYVFSPDALFEVDRKSGIVNTISLNRVSISMQPFEDSCSRIFIDRKVHVPARIEKPDKEYIERCLAKYPNSD